MKRISLFTHLKAILVPFTVTILIPLAILYYSNQLRLDTVSGISIAIGVLLILAGLFLLITTNILFAQIGKGTLAPWNPTQKLVIMGPYRFVRNPMICGVLLILLGETILFSSFYLLLWFAYFWARYDRHSILREEPQLLARFGNEYLVYKENVPMWIPRIRPWTPESGIKSNERTMSKSRGVKNDEI